MKKRILSIVLAIAMLACMIPLGTMTAFAKTTPEYFFVKNTSSATATLQWIKNGSNGSATFYYSTDGVNFGNSMSAGSSSKATKLSLAPGNTVYFRSEFPKTVPTSDTNNNIYLKCTGSGVTLKIGGDLTTLLNNEGNVTSLASYSEYIFYRFFYGLNALTDASELKLPSTTLKAHCYDGMFYNCSALKNTPALPAKTLADYCYHEMFYGCRALVNAPALPATTLANHCYDSMFYNCRVLVNAPVMAPTTVADSCCFEMFMNCNALVDAPALALPAKTLANSCYRGMFYSCYALVNAPALPATTLADSCYQSMFQNCKALNSITVGFKEFNPSSATYNWLVGSVPANGVAFVPEDISLTTRGYDTILAGWTLVKPSEVRTVTNKLPEAAAKTNNGYLTLTRDKSFNGEVFTVTVVPAEGYVLTANSLKVTYNTDQTIIPEPAGTKGQYKYTMPDYNVTVTAAFKEIPAGIPVDVPTAVTGLVYNSEEQTGVAAGTGYTVTNGSATNAGEYTATATLADGYIWSDYSTDPVNIEWSIAKKSVDVPTITGVLENMFLYTGNEITALESNGYYTVTDGSKTAAGKYTAKVTPTKNCEWEDGSTDTKTVEWEIMSVQKYNLIFEICETDGLMARQGKIIDSKVSDTIGRTIIPLTQEQIDSIGNYIWVVGFDGNKDFKVEVDCAYTWFYNVEDGVAKKICAEDLPGNYAAFIIIDNDGTQNDDNTVTGFGYYRLYADSEDNFMFDTIYQDPNIKYINIKYIDVPTAVTGLTYNGETQTGVIEGEGYTLSGTTSAKDVGNYTATATLKFGYFWKDGSNENKTIDWSIAKAPTKIDWPWDGSRDYDGQEHVWYYEGYTDAEHVEVVSGTASAIDVGDYTVTVKPKDGYCWQDGTQDEQIVDWHIYSLEEE